MNESLHLNMLDLIKKSKAGDREAQTVIVEKNIGLVWSIVKRFQNRGYDTDDLFQIGCIGLIKSIQKFDLSFDVKFSTYAVPMIIGEIKRFLRDDGIIKVSRSLKETANKVRGVKEILTNELGREPTLSEISERLDISPEDIVVAMEAGCTPESLHSTVNEGDSSAILLMDKIGNSESCESEIVDKITLMQVLKELDERERKIIFLRYFKEKTQVQIAKILGISQVQVSRIEKKILQGLKEKIKYG